PLWFHPTWGASAPRGACQGLPQLEVQGAPLRSMKATGKEARGGDRKRAEKTEKTEKPEKPEKPEAKGTRKIRFCMYYLQGVCKYTDETCDFAHSTEEIGPEGRAARRTGRKAGQAAPAPAGGPDAPRGKNAAPPGRVAASSARAGSCATSATPSSFTGSCAGSSGTGSFEAPAPRPGGEGCPGPPGQRRRGGAAQPAAVGPTRPGAAGPGPEPMWLASPEQVHLQYPGAGDLAAMELFARQRECSRRLHAGAEQRGFPPPPGILPHAGAGADPSIGGLQRSIADLSQAIRNFVAQPSALQDPFGGAGQHPRQPREGLSEAHMAARCALQGVPRGGRSGAPHVRYDDAGAVDKLAPRKVAVSPQPLSPGGLGCGGPLAAEEALYGRPPPRMAAWAPPGLGS
ncbi:unnamed protein product, partial [Prorocentrum cordatum]